MGGTNSRSERQLWKITRFSRGEGVLEIVSMHMKSICDAEVEIRAFTA